MDRLASMAAFVKAAEVGSFAAAADALTMSPQMIAKHVTWLERRIGARLLNRTTRRQSLTEIGTAYYNRCKLVLAQADWADSLANEAIGDPRGRLRVNAPISFGTHTLTPVIARYLREYPKVEVDLVLSDHFVDLVEDEFEAVFRIGPLADSSLTARELTPFRLVACASPHYLRERGVPTDPGDLETHDCLVYGSRSNPTMNDWRFTRGGNTWQVNVKHRFQANNANALLVAALDGLGIAFIAQDLAREGLRSGRLAEVLPDYAAASRPIHIIYHRDRMQTPKLKSFISVVMSTLGLRQQNQPEAV